MPPSLLRLAACAASVVMGCRTNRPTSDHVPELTISARPGFFTGAAAKALAVSCDPTATMSAAFNPSDAASGACRQPMRVPGSTISGSSLRGMPSAFRIGPLHCRRRASMSCVTLANVESTWVQPPR